MKSFNPLRHRVIPHLTKVVAHLRVEVVDTRNRVFNVAALEGFTYVHSALDALKIHRRRQTCLLAELFRSRLVSLDDKIVHDQTVQVPVDSRNMLSTDEPKCGAAKREE